MYKFLFLSFGNILKKIICLWTFAIVNMKENLKIMTQLCKNNIFYTQSGWLCNGENLRDSMDVLT